MSDYPTASHSPSTALAAVERFEAEWADDAPTVRMDAVDDDGRPQELPG